ncbi:hypothetical protein [Leucothrix arctica]|uniref:Uncharacterized protein n=1 Tax=Leucothrix arctica TaxID=1481894 RepID=A0A317CMN2_9GAMM|nr:hypothetical protein [Leucothrix arctica]PWQ97572.1 hypothetical protein DKT75_06540 [Leucothrix arctica]
MLGSLLFIAALVTCVGLLTAIYRRQPLKRLTLIKPGIVFFPKYIAAYTRSDADVALTIGQLGFRRNEMTGLYSRGTMRTGLNTKSIKLTISMDYEKKEISIYSSFFGILFDNGDIWQLAHDAINGLEVEKDRTQALVDLFDNK